MLAHSTSVHLFDSYQGKARDSKRTRALRRESDIVDHVEEEEEIMEVPNPYLEQL